MHFQTRSRRRPVLSVCVSVCVCTYFRPALLRRCLTSLLEQQAGIEYEVVLVDNDRGGSAQAVFQELAGAFARRGRSIQYGIEPEQGISAARNRCVQMARGRYVAFLDDDETADPKWLETLHGAILKYEADGVFGPVIPYFPDGFPEWQKPLFARKCAPTGCDIRDRWMATGNVLVKTDVLRRRAGPFNAALGRIGGGDQEIFRWLSDRGARFVWCNEALAYEVQSLERASLKWHLRRAYRGGWGFSRQKATSLGFGKALALTLAWVIPAGIKNGCKAVKSGNCRRIGLSWMRTAATQCGKIGYFLGLNVKEYTERK